MFRNFNPSLTVFLLDNKQNVQRPFLFEDDLKTLRNGHETTQKQFLQTNSGHFRYLHTSLQNIYSNEPMIEMGNSGAKHERRNWMILQRNDQREFRGRMYYFNSSWI
jgi:hypothetical protein